MKKVLIIATVDQHIKHFHMPLIRELVKQGFQVDIASNGNSDFEYISNKYNVSFNRHPFSLDNIFAYKQLSKILKTNYYDIVHVNTPVGAAIGRLVTKRYRKFGTKICYTAHGFHFFKGAKLINWLLFFPLEWWLSLSTDTLFVMNQEDMELSKRFFRKPDVIFVNGVGVNNHKFYPVNDEYKCSLRRKLSLSADKVYLLYVAELSERKNQNFLIESFFEYQKMIRNVELLLIGKGALDDQYREKILNMGLNDKIHLLGYQKNIAQYYQAADILVSSSKQEGLPVNIIEGQFCNLPAVVSDCRGNRDLVVNGLNGFIFTLNENTSKRNFIEDIKKIVDNPDMGRVMGKQNEANREKFLEGPIQKIIISQYQN